LDAIPQVVQHPSCGRLIRGREAAKPLKKNGNGTLARKVPDPEFFQLLDAGNGPDVGKGLIPYLIDLSKHGGEPPR
jgi:hypothetical protein